MRENDRSETGNHPNGIIQIGGKATRLGPLAAQISKGLVSIGNRPQVVNQILDLRAAGCRQIVVVTSESTYNQTADLIKRAGLDGKAKVIADPHQLGPVMGIAFAFENSIINMNASTYVLFGDTVLSQPLPKEGDWVGISATYDDTRSWCYASDDGMFYDGIPEDNEPVTIGVYRFDDTRSAYKTAVMAAYRSVEPVGMSGFLSTYPHPLAYEEFESWQDVGDLMALAAARRTRFISRAHHVLNLHDDGTITKHGATEEEVQFMQMIGELPNGGQTLFPVVYDVGLDSYTMEYVDLPTLAELWLYWPGSGDTWAKIVRGIVNRLERDLWRTTKQQRMTSAEVTRFFGQKAVRRIGEWRPELLDSELLTAIASACEIIGEDVWIHGHGDLNFTNILYSLNTANFKLLDPRGGRIPQLYEYAKLAYSPLFSAVTHDLIEGPVPQPLPVRDDETKAVIEELTKDIEPQRLTAAIALTLLAACPLHVPAQAEVFYKYGRRMLDAVTRQEA